MPISETGVIGPILLQRQCDYGKGDMTEEEWTQVLAERLEGAPIPACWIVFQWWWGSSCTCPGCGRHFLSGLDELKRYRLDYSLNPTRMIASAQQAIPNQPR